MFYMYVHKSQFIYVKDIHRSKDPKRRVVNPNGHQGEIQVDEIKHSDWSRVSLCSLTSLCLMHL